MSVSGFSQVILGVTMTCTGKLVHCEVARFDPKTGKPRKVPTYRMNLSVKKGAFELLLPPDNVVHYDDTSSKSPNNWAYDHLRQRIWDFARAYVGDEEEDEDCLKVELVYQRNYVYEVVIGAALASGSSGRSENLQPVLDPQASAPVIQTKLLACFKRLAPQDTKLHKQAKALQMYLITAAG